MEIKQHGVQGRAWAVFDNDKLLIVKKTKEGAEDWVKAQGGPKAKRAKPIVSEDLELETEVE